MSKAKPKPATPAEPQPVDYALPIPHEHAGVAYPAGATLALYPDQIALIESVAAAHPSTAQ